MWVTPDNWRGKQERPEAWVKVYEGQHAASPDVLVKLTFPTPVIIRGGTSIGMCVLNPRRAVLTCCVCRVGRD